MIFLRYAILIMLTLALTACNEERDIHYYMTHPLELKNKMDDCNSTKAPPPSICIVVYKALAKFTSLMNIQQSEPERYGDFILEKETEYVTTKQNLEITRYKYQLLQDNGGSAAALKKTFDDIQLLFKQERDQAQDIEELLSVVSISSPT